jgi:hypothetical protein
LSLPKNDQGKVNLDLLLTAFSLAIKGDVLERLTCLFHLPLRGKVEEETNLTIEQIEDILGNAMFLEITASFGARSCVDVISDSV